MSLSSTPHSFEPEEPSPAERPSWLVSALVALVCLAVVASGWSVATFVVGDFEDSLDVARHPEPGPPATVAASTVADPTDAQAYVAVAAQRVDDSSAFHITFTVHDGAPENASPDSGDGEDAGEQASTTGRGRVTYDSAAAPKLDHLFTTVDDHRVHRYEVGQGQLMMTTERGLELLDPPSEADRYLCSRGYGSAKLHEVLDTSTDLSLDGLEEVRLESPGLDGTHSAYHYTGTFTTMLGGYDPEDGRNTLTAVEDAGFDLWIDERGYPRRLDYRAADGAGESYEYHSFS